MFSMLAAFAVTIGLLFLTLHLLRRLNGSAGARGRVPMTMIQRVATGPKQSVGLLRVGDRVLVVSLAERGTTLLTELSGDALRDAIAEAPAATPAQRVAPFRLALGKAMGFARVGTLALVMSVGAHAARAQAPAPAPAPKAGANAPANATANATANAPATPAPATPAPATPAAPGFRTGTRLSPSAARAALSAALAAPQAPTAPTIQATIPIQPIAPRPGKQAIGARGPTLPVPSVSGPASPKVDFNIGQGDSQLKLTGTVGLVVFLGAMTVLPALFLLMTSFTRVLIVLHFLRSALGTQTAPPSQLLVALSVLLTGVIMHPVLDRVTADALTPYFDGRLSQVEAYNKGVLPFREFMLANVRESDIASFADMSGITNVKSVDDLPTVTIVAAFVTSELRTSFQMGFAIFLPFIVVDMIVASVLMSMGMMMLPPAMVSLPFKLLLFVLADGWTLVIRNLVASFKV